MSHEPVTHKPLPPAALAARHRAKSFAFRFVSLICAVLAVALVVAQGALAFQEQDTPEENAAEAQAQRQQTVTPTSTRSPAPTESPKGTPSATPLPTATPRVMRVYRNNAELKTTPTPPPTPAPCPPNVTCPPPTATPSPTPSPTPAFANHEDAMSAGMSDIVIVEVEGLKQLVNRAKCLKEQPNEEGTAIETVRITDGCRDQSILLFIDGRPLKGMPPESGAPKVDADGNGTLRYHLLRPAKSDAVSESDVADTKEHLEDLLGYGPGEFLGKIPPGLTRRVSVSVGLASEYPIDTEVEAGGTAGPFTLVRVRWKRLAVWLALLVGFGLGFLWLARNRDIIRDRKPIAWLRGDKQRKAYSLARTQIAWWSFFVALGFIFIWLVMDQYELSESALVLLGISVVTTAGATRIDKSRTFDTAGESQATDADLSRRLTEKEAMEENLRRIDGTVSEEKFAEEYGKYKTHIAEIRQKFPTALGWNTDRFFIDILSDANGISIQRFQMVFWTVILGLIFIHEVVSRLSMPEFSGTLLALMGISNGAYLLSKSSEPQATPASGHTTPDPTGEVSSPPDETVASPPDETSGAASEATTNPDENAADEEGGLTSPP